jgi:hypothetical protein
LGLVAAVLSVLAVAKAAVLSVPTVAVEAGFSVQAISKWQLVFMYKL